MYFINSLWESILLKQLAAVLFVLHARSSCFTHGVRESKLICACATFAHAVCKTSTKSRVSHTPLCNVILKIGGLACEARRGAQPPSIYMRNFRSTEHGENFKSSETWLNLFKIMKKNRNQFLMRYMQMFKSYSNLKISKF